MKLHRNTWHILLAPQDIWKEKLRSSQFNHNLLPAQWSHHLCPVKKWIPLKFLVNKDNLFSLIVTVCCISLHWHIHAASLWCVSLSQTNSPVTHHLCHWHGLASLKCLLALHVFVSSFCKVLQSSCFRTIWWSVPDSSGRHSFQQIRSIVIRIKASVYETTWNLVLFMPSLIRR